MKTGCLGGWKIGKSEVPGGGNQKYAGDELDWSGSRQLEPSNK